MNTKLTFTNRQEYLAWRAQWRADYAALTNTIREYKAQRKDSSADTRSLAQCHCYICRRKAHAMLEERKESKIIAGQQYQAAKAALQTAA